MCFVLYVGTANPLPRKKFDHETGDLPVESLTERDAVIKQHFSRPEVQYVGSTSSCGCDYPHAMFQNGGWPEIEFHDIEQKHETDAEKDRVYRQNCEALVSLLCASGEELVEIYGVWDGDFGVGPKAHEDIAGESLRKPNFCFKEKGFYRVHLKPWPKS